MRQMKNLYFKLKPPGLGNEQTVRNLCQLIKEKRPKIVFLMETKMQQRRMGAIKNKTGYSEMFVVDWVERSGGLALLWGDEFNVEIQNYTRRHINAKINTNGIGSEWKFTGFYGHSEVHKRHEILISLRNMVEVDDLGV